MDSTIPITSDVYFVGVNDRETHLFEGIWPLPRGVCYNSYLIDDDNVALIDCVKAGFLRTTRRRIRGLQAFVESEKGWQLVDPVVEAHGSPKPEDYENCASSARTWPKPPLNRRDQRAGLEARTR